MASANPARCFLAAILLAATGCQPSTAGKPIQAADGLDSLAKTRAVEPLPVLERAVWEDRSPPGGNLVVDQGDWVRLVFDRPVRLAAAGAEQRARSPLDILLSKASDRLDDGQVHAVFRLDAERDREVVIELGSRPVLNVSGTLAPDVIERFAHAAPSGLAVNGTAVLPMPKITDAAGGPGCMSNREVDIEYAADFRPPSPIENQDFPPPGARRFHTLTPVQGGRALLVGGESPAGRQALDQVLVVDPAREGAGLLRLAGGQLPRPTSRHTATLLAGPDDLAGTADDVVLVAGGSDGAGGYLADLTLLRPLADGGVEVQPLDTGLRLARSEHAAVAVGGLTVLIDGGMGSSSGGIFDGLAGCAELITLAIAGEKARVAEHLVFRSLARTGHTLTLLPPADDGQSYVLAYGGFGRNRRRFLDPVPFGTPIAGPIPDDLFLKKDREVVLVSPILIAVANPMSSITDLQYDFSLPLLRRGHAAFLLDPAAGAGTHPVLLAGGTSRHASRFDEDPSLWELPPEAQIPMELLRGGSLPLGHDRLLGRWIPRGHEAASAVIFRFDAREPGKSRLDVVPHPLPDPSQLAERDHFAAVEVPGLGVVILGGEEMGDPREVRSLSSIEVYLPAEERLAELAVRLTAGRAYHTAFLAANGTERWLLVLGGVAATGSREGFRAVEKVPVR
jgi:hypothetical protein